MSGRLFPFEKVRDEQGELLEDVYKAVSEGKNLLANAPTGVGKTAAALAPAVECAIKNGKTVFFLTPKHSQHTIAVETLKRIKKRHKQPVKVVNLIGKQWTCLFSGVKELPSSEFSQFCKAHKSNETCAYYKNVRDTKDNTVKQEAKTIAKNITKKGPLHSNELLEMCVEKELCPYEVAAEASKDANVVICDYYYLFHPHIRQALMNKTGKSLEDLILIVDEAHNVPGRVRSLMGKQLSEFVVTGALKEAGLLRHERLEKDLREILKIVRKFGKTIEENKYERYVKRENVVGAIEDKLGIELQNLIDELNDLGLKVLEEPDRYRSFCLSVSEFLEEWGKDRETESAYARLIEKKIYHGDEKYGIALKCLDPAVATTDLFKEVYSSVLMSGTLTPMDMYADVLGIDKDRTELKTYKNPFPKGNRLVLMVPNVTTRYKMRGEYMFKKIASELEKVIKLVPKNVAIFFPSYSLMDNIVQHLDGIPKTLLLERKEMKKTERNVLYKQLKELSETGDGGCLFAVQAGSFSEGMDFPGRILDCVVVVGLPLRAPTLETEALVKYYDFKFKRGWDYGYIFPAMNRVLQAAGRCIRSEEDRGAIVLMDERFQWANYKKCFPPGYRFIVTEKPEMYLEKFFG